MELLHKDLTDRILKAFYEVYNELGWGFLERVYQNALFLELTKSGFFVETQKRIRVHYKEREVGEYYADMVVDEMVILELKAAECLIPEFECQLTNYLRATSIEVGLLLNFGPKPAFCRKVFTNDRKKLTERG